METGKIEEKTEIHSGAENTVSVALECFARVKQTHDSCGDYTLPSVFVSTEPIKEAFIKLRKRGIKTRFITEITRENISYCKELMNIVHDLRHLDGIKGNFGVSESDYMASATQKGGEAIAQIIHSNVRAIIEQHQFFFETLWNKAIPAEQRIEEIEKGVKPIVIETIRDPSRIQSRAFELVEEAKNEILIIFSTANAFHRQEKAGSVKLLETAARNGGINVRVMTPVDDHIRKVAERLKKETTQRIEIRSIEESMQTKISVLIVDRSYLLVVELKNDSEEASKDAIGLATYSNSRATVISYASIFETLWNQNELYEQIQYLYEQLKTHDKMQSEFINIAAHELRTPVQPILGLAQVLQDQSPNPTQSKFLDAIVRNARRLQQLQEDILDVSRIESNTLRLERKNIDLDKVLLERTEAFDRRYVRSNKKVKLRCHSGAGRAMVRADKSRIIQVIDNLLENALRHTRNGVISIKTTKDKDQIMVRIKDAGTGIDPDIMPRLFTKFATKSAKGTGLGLYISKNIIEAHGGKIWASNNKSKPGATFTFTLPLVKERS